MTYQSFAQQVWDNLSAINVNDQTKQKGNMTYLSWTWAWQRLMEEYPESEYVFDAPVTLPDGSVEVWVSLIIKQQDKKLLRRMWLPVMDHRKQAIKNPDARQLSDARMRCLTKAMAMCGLGHYIYAGEDIPTAEAANVEYITEEQAATIHALAEEVGASIPRFLKYIQAASIDAIRADEYENAVSMLEKKRKS